MALRSIGARQDLVTLEAPIATIPDGHGGHTQTFGPLVPATMWAEVAQASPSDLTRIAGGGQGGTVFATASHTVRMPFHPGVTSYARLTWTDRGGRAHRGAVLGVGTDPVCGETILLVQEIVGMSASVKLDGVDEFLRELRQLPPDLASEGAAIVYAHVDAAAASITAATPFDPARRRGRHLRDSLEVIKEGLQFGAFGLLRNRAFHAHIVESGSASRTWRGKALGSAPARHFLIPRAIVIRRRMIEALKAMLVAHGLTVTGSAE